METIVVIILFVFGLLQFILFFKIWGMTNDVGDIKNLLKKSFAASHPVVKNRVPGDEDFANNSHVVELKTGKQMRTGKKLNNGKYMCYSNHVYVGDFAAADIMDFEQWVKEVHNK